MHLAFTNSDDAFPLYTLSVEQYHRMIEAGVITKDDRVELIDGLLIKKMSKNPPHSLATQKLARILFRMLPDSICAFIQEPITLPESEPEPDITIARGKLDDYAQKHPGAADILVVIEVAERSLLDDRKFKTTLYARHLIPQYWIVNLVDRQIEIFSDPVADKTVSNYRSRIIVEHGGVGSIDVAGRSYGKFAVADVIR